MRDERSKRGSKVAAGKRTKLQPRDSELSTHNSQTPFRIGFGNDVHRLIPRRPLILGGVRIPSDNGPAGHSDGDALAHAITDALLGAAALGDIGVHFPDTSPKWRNVSSLLFLRQTRKLLGRAGFDIVNVDATISLERPKLRPHIPAMRGKVATTLGIKPSQVSVKAKTGEGLDCVGRGEAIRADAVALIAKTANPRGKP